MKLLKNDLVLVVSGKDKGKTGTIQSVNIKSQKIIVTGVNIYKKNAKVSAKFPKGGIIDLPVPISISNAVIICPACSKTAKVKYKKVNDKKSRICSKCHESLDKPKEITGK